MRKAVDSALGLLDSGAARVAERGANGQWQVNQWLKKAVLLSFRLNDMSVIAGGPGKAVWWDKVDSKFKGWNAARFRRAGFRAVPGSVVRRSGGRTHSSGHDGPEGLKAALTNQSGTQPLGNGETPNKA